MPRSAECDSSLTLLKCPKCLVKSCGCAFSVMLLALAVVLPTLHDYPIMPLPGGYIASSCIFFMWARRVNDLQRQLRQNTDANFMQTFVKPYAMPSLFFIFSLLAVTGCHGNGMLPHAVAGTRLEHGSHKAVPETKRHTGG